METNPHAELIERLKVLSEAIFLRRMIHAEQAGDVQEVISMLSTPPPQKVCGTCKFHDKSTDECENSHNVKFKINAIVNGWDGWVDGFSPDPDFGCSLWQPREEG